jgi:hypothetical protein
MAAVFSEMERSVSSGDRSHEFGSILANTGVKFSINAGIIALGMDKRFQDRQG